MIVRVFAMTIWKISGQFLLIEVSLVELDTSEPGQRSKLTASST